MPTTINEVELLSALGNNTLLIKTEAMCILIQQHTPFFYEIRINVREKSEPLEHAAVNMHLRLFCIARDIIRADVNTE